MCLAFGVLGLFVICEFLGAFKRQQVYFTGIVLYVHILFNCFLEALGVHGTFLKGIWRFEELLFPL